MTQKCNEKNQSKNSQIASREILDKSLDRLRDSIIPQIGSSRKIVRILWVVIYLGLFVFFSYSFKNLVCKYTSYPTRMDLIVETSSQLVFPAVTVCNENPVRKSMIKRLQKFSELVVLENYVTTMVGSNAQQINSDHQTEKEIVCPEGMYIIGTE